MMLVKLKFFITVIWLTFLSLVHSFPIISEEMSALLEKCPFPPDDVKGSDDLKSMCVLKKPDPRETVDVKFLFTNYVCMELFDVSLQLCEPKFANKTPKTEDFKKNYPLPKADEFCNKLNFFGNRHETTRYWADVAIMNLKIPARCKQFCVSDENLHPLCGAIFIGNQLLIALSSMQQQAPELTAKAVVPVIGNEPVSIKQFNVGENENKNPSLGAIRSMPKEIHMTNAEEIVPKPNIQNKISDDIKSIDLKPENKNKQDTGPINQFQGQPNINKAVANEQHLEPKDNVQSQEKSITESLSSSAPSIPPVSPTASSTETEVLYKAIANSPTDEHDEANGDTFKSKGSVDAVNDGLNPYPDDDAGDGDSKLINLEDPISHSVPREDADDEEQEEMPQNLPNSIGGQSYYSKAYPDRTIDVQDSHFFAYFLTMVVICIVGYLIFHNKQKIIALALEGRRMQGSRRRPNTSSYKKLDSNLEEAVTSTCSSSSVTHVIF